MNLPHPKNAMRSNLQDRSGSSRQADKKLELARHALSALAEDGFARINLRGIAARSGVSLGTIHYYFKDKTALLICCVQLYKSDFVNLLTERIDSAHGLPELIEQFSETLVDAVETHAETHRLWYDMRGQALFDAAFQPLVEEIETQLIGVVQRFVSKSGELAGANAANSADSLTNYIMLDGWFRYFLQQHIAGNRQACTEFRQRLRQMVSALYP